MATEPSDVRTPPLVLTTKLHAPAPRANRVHRQRLLDRLDSGSRSALALVSAPAGFGKSTLIGDWLNRRGQLSAWLSLDEGDSDLRRFLTYLSATLDRALPGVARGVAAALSAPSLPEPDVLVTPLLNELWGKPECFLVLDDYHAIQAAEVHAALTFLLEHLPPEIHLMVATRVDPPLPLPRLRARNLLCELRAEDLRFTHEEAALFLRETMGLDVSPREVAALEDRTEGWIAGLQMAALSLRGRDDVSAFIAGFTGSHRFVLDYLSEEVLDRLPPGRIDFLLRASILSRFCGPLCDAVTGRTDGQEILESLETANLFLIPLDDRRGWYRFHHLFADLLQDELRRRVDDSGLADLHARAADWFAAGNLPDEAMDHAVAARDWERAVRIVQAHANATIHRGELGTASRWFAALPEECFRRHPRLLVTRTLLLFSSFRFPEFAASLQELERVAAGADDPILIAGLDSLRALALAGQGDHQGVILYATRALERLPADEHRADRALVALVLGMSLGRAGQSARGLEMLEEAAVLTLAEGNLVLHVVARANQGWIDALHGRLRQSLERCRQALDLFQETQLPAAGQALSVVADHQLERGELDLALETGLTSTRLSRAGQVMGHHIKGLCTLARIHMSRGEFDEARQVMDEIRSVLARTLVRTWDVLTESLVQRIDVMRAKREGRPDLLGPCLRWAEEKGLLEGWDDLRGRLMPDLPHDYAHFTVAHALHGAGRRKEALDLIAALRKIAEAENWCRSILEADVLEALCVEDETAFESLKRAVAFAETEGYVQVFADEGEPMARLLASSRAPRGPFADLLRQRLGGGAPAPKPAPLPDDLSDRELEVLRAVAGGLSNAEAARRLYLSPFTVKKHLENIYGKLGVRNRTEAIARVQKLGLLEV